MLLSQTTICLRTYSGILMHPIKMAWLNFKTPQPQICDFFCESTNLASGERVFSIHLTCSRGTTLQLSGQDQYPMADKGAEKHQKRALSCGQPGASLPAARGGGFVLQCTAVRSPHQLSPDHPPVKHGHCRHRPSLTSLSQALPTASPAPTVTMTPCVPQSWPAFVPQLHSLLLCCECTILSCSEKHFMKILRSNYVPLNKIISRITASLSLSIPKGKGVIIKIKNQSQMQMTELASQGVRSAALCCPSSDRLSPHMSFPLHRARAQLLGL